MYKRLISSALCVLATCSYAATALAENNDYYIACYYNDTDESIDGQNPKLMWPSKFYVGARKNYYWALDPSYDFSTASYLSELTLSDETEFSFSPYIKLTGHIEDGFFLEEYLTYDDVVRSCNYAIQQGLLLWPSRPSYKLYEFKASTSNLDAFEYPIHFSNDETNKYKINKVVIFGDSLSDTGNLQKWTKILPYYPYWYGRFSDGFIWDDYFTRNTHLPILNFAYGGAKSEGVNNIFLDETFLSSLELAIKNKITGNTRDTINTYLSKYLTKDSYNSNSSMISDPKGTLFIIWIGGNDYADSLLFQDKTQRYFDYPNGPGGINQIQISTVQNIVDQVSTLNKKGAYHFLVINLPNMGVIPLAAKTSYIKNSGDVVHKEDNVEYVSQKLSQVITKHNKDLQNSLTMLQSSLGNKIDIVYLDINASLSAFLHNKSFLDNSKFNYGSVPVETQYQIPGSANEYILDSCYSSSFYNAALTSTSQKAFDFAFTNTCKDNRGVKLQNAVFWDKLHPTTYTHCWIAFAIEQKLIESGLISAKLMDMQAYKNECLALVNYKNLLGD